MAAPKGNRYYAKERRGLTPLDRFREKCRFEPETGCVVWAGGKTKGRGHNVDYGSFWFEGRRWFAHRWAAKFVHGLDLDGFQIDHCCDTLPVPNTLCVQHLQAISAADNRLLQHARRKKFIHLQVGLLSYEDVYGPQPEPDDLIPFHTPPEWLNWRPRHDHDPFD